MRTALVLLAALAASQPAFAQDASADDDWNLIQRPEQKLTMAATVFDTGIGIAVRCLDGNFEVLLAGLPAAEGPTRRLRVGLNGAELYDESWTGTDDPTAWFSDFPMNFARRMRGGGTLNVIVPGENGQPNRRYVLGLPASTTAIDTVLTACGRPLVDMRSNPVTWVAEDGSIPDLQWGRRPMPTYPDKAVNGRVGAGRVVLSCIVQPQGRVDDCVVESERPGGYGFGEASRRAAQRSTMAVPADPAEAALIVGRRISFAINYRMAE